MTRQIASPMSCDLLLNTFAYIRLILIRSLSLRDNLYLQNLSINSETARFCGETEEKRIYFLLHADERRCDAQWTAPARRNVRTKAVRR